MSGDRFDFDAIGVAAPLVFLSIGLAVSAVLVASAQWPNGAQRCGAACGGPFEFREMADRQPESCVCLVARDAGAAP